VLVLHAFSLSWTRQARRIALGNTGLYLVVLYLSVDGWLSADHVWDSSGTKLVGLQGGNETISTQFNQVTKEIYYIPLARGYLEAHRRSGFSIFLGCHRSKPLAFKNWLRI
jgi:hypothetical protein